MVAISTIGIWILVLQSFGLIPITQKVYVELAFRISKATAIRIEKIIEGLLGLWMITPSLRIILGGLDFDGNPSLSDLR